MGPSPRGTAILAVATTAALALGGLWWVRNAPPPSGLLPGPPPPPPTVVYTAQPQSHPHPSEIVQFDLDQVERLLPARVEVVRGNAGVLTDGGTIDYSGPVPAGTEYLLEVACLAESDGDGELRIEVVTPDGSQHGRTLACDGTVGAVEFAANSTGPAVILLMARTTQFVGVAVQLVLR
jgi:hypothetical protein